MAFREHKNFGEEFNPFKGQKKLKGPKGDSSLGRSRRFMLGEEIVGFVGIDREAHIFGDDNAHLLALDGGV